jgi:hypothetical protein
VSDVIEGPGGNVFVVIVGAGGSVCVVIVAGGKVGGWALVESSWMAGGFVVRVALAGSRPGQQTPSYFPSKKQYPTNRPP